MITITLYIKACANCGKDKVEVAKLQRYAYGAAGVTLRIKDSRYNEDNRRNHQHALGMIGLKADAYPSVLYIEFDPPREDGTKAIYQTLSEFIRINT